MKNVASDQATGPAAVQQAAGASALPDVWLGIRRRVQPYRFPLAFIGSVGLVVAGRLVEDRSTRSSTSRPRPLKTTP